MKFVVHLYDYVDCKMPILFIQKRVKKNKNIRYVAFHSAQVESNYVTKANLLTKLDKQFLKIAIIGSFRDDLSPPWFLN